MIVTCKVCTSPLSSVDRDCPVCGEPVRPAAPPRRRQILLDDDVSGSAAQRGGNRPTAPTGGGSSAGTGTPSPSAGRAAVPPAPPGGVPPGPSAAAAAGSAATLSRGCVVRGTVTGPVASDQYVASSAGQRFLVRSAGVVLVAGLLLSLVMNGLPVLGGIVGSLVQLLVILGALLLVMRVVLSPLLGRRRRDRAGPSILGSAARGTARGAGSMLAAPLRWSGGEDQTIKVSRFRVVTIDGVAVDCELIGEQVGGELRGGDIVEVHGRRTGHGTVRAREVVVTTSGSRITARRNAPYVLARAANVLAVVVLVVVAVFVLYLILGPRT